MAFLESRQKFDITEHLHDALDTEDDSIKDIYEIYSYIQF